MSVLVIFLLKGISDVVMDVSIDSVEEKLIWLRGIFVNFKNR